MLGRLGVRHLWPLIPVLGAALPARGPVTDNSFLWHVGAGRLQLELGEVLRADPFSISLAGAAWRTQSWLADLGYGWLEGRAAELVWVPWMIFAVIAVSYALLGTAVYADTRSVPAVTAALILLLWLGNFAARPVLLSYLGLALVAVAVRFERGLAWTLVPVIWIWAALHGSWIVGVGLIVLEAAARRSSRLAGAAAAGVLFASFTAHGLGVWQILYRFATNREALALIEEWQPVDFTRLNVVPYLIFIAALLLAAVRGRISGRDLVVVVPFVVFGLLNRRSLFPAALVLAPYAARAIPGPPARSAASARERPGLNWAIAGLVTAVALALVAVAPTGADPERFPVAAAQRLPAGVVFHSDAVGGYLIYAHPGRGVFVDDRVELYGAEFFSRYGRARAGHEWEPLFAETGVEAALLEADAGLVERLVEAAWTEAYRDDEYVVLTRPDPG